MSPESRIWEIRPFGSMRGGKELVIGPCAFQSILSRLLYKTTEWDRHEKNGDMQEASSSHTSRSTPLLFANLLYLSFSRFKPKLAPPISVTLAKISVPNFSEQRR